MSPQELLKGLEDTFFMLLGSGLCTLLLGLPLGVILALTAKNQLLERPKLYKTLSLLVNTTRSIPFIIFMILIAPLTRLLTGTTVGCLAAIVPLTLACVPFFARLCENAIQHLPRGLIEAAESLGATPWQIVTKVLIPESMPQLINAFTVALVHLVGYTAISGALGSGGLGSIAIHKGYFALRTDYMLVSVILLFLIVQLIQSSGDYLARRKARNHR
jgi:ABC-type methionine transport system permease subunit